MLFNAKYITLATLVAVVVSQQPPQCVLECSQGALGSATNTSCKAITDPCVCDDLGFQKADAACLQKSCSAEDQAAAAQLQQMFCGGGGNMTATTEGATATGSKTSATETESSKTETETESSKTKSMSSMTMSGSMSSMTMPTSTSTGSSSAPSPSKSNGAGPQVEFGQTGLFTFGVAAAGAIVGGLLL